MNIRQRITAAIIFVSISAAAGVFTICANRFAADSESIIAALGLSAVVCVAAAVFAMLLSSMAIKPLTNASNTVANKQLDKYSRGIYKEAAPLMEALRENGLVIDRLKRELSDGVENLYSIIGAMSEGIIITDINSLILMSNTCADSLFGSEALRGKSALAAFRGSELYGCISSALNGVSRTGKLLRNGKTYQVMANPVFSSLGDSGERKQLGAACLMLDITEHESIDSIKREFTANVSHELKTPLTVISGYAEMIAAGLAADEDCAVMGAKIVAESKRMLALIADIIKLSSLEDGNMLMEMEITDTDLSEPAAECVRALKPFAEKCSVAISTEGCGHAVCDKKMIFELIYNLLDNAIRYNVTGGSATVKVADKLISVKDTGIGISDEHKSRIFERFYRIDKSRSRMTGGTGLGLAIVKHIAESHGAKISVISSPGKGTEFNVTFKE